MFREEQKRTRNQFRVQGVMLGAPTGIRTPVLALKGLRPGPLDDGGIGAILTRAVLRGQRLDRLLPPFPRYEGTVMGLIRLIRRSSIRERRRGSISSNVSADVITVGRFA